MPDSETPLRVGLTGNIGAGKSTVGQWMHERGLAVLDADRIAHDLLRRDGPVKDRVIATFGAAVNGDGEPGTIDRAALGRIVFEDAEARRKLEDILHPAIRNEEDRRAQIAAATRPIVVTEAALLVETGGAKRYHRLVVVSAPVAVRLARVVARGLDRAAAERRMAAQMADAAKAAVADYVIDNGGALQTTRAATLTLCDALAADLQRLRRGEAVRPRSWR